ncbi:MAG: recombinase family protein [Nitrospira sp.]|nr:recombinase family protein [Nitrospira sp.]
MGRLMRNILLDFAQFEREMTADRTRDKMQQRAEKGMWNGGIVPYGYSVEAKQLIIHSKESARIRFIFQYFSQEGSLSRLRMALHHRSWYPRTGRLWSKTQLDYILRNPLYVGKIRFNGNLYPGQHEALVAQDIFERVQSLHRKRTHSDTKIARPYILQGLLKCSSCHSVLTPHYTQNRLKNGNIQRTPYYRCTKTMHHSFKACSIKLVNADQAEHQILASLQNLSKDEPYIQGIVDELNQTLHHSYGPLEQEAKEFRGQIKDIEGELQRYVRALGKGSISLGRLEREIKRREEDQKALARRLEEVEKQMQKAELQDFNGDLLIQELGNFQKNFSLLSPKEQTEALQCLVKDIEVYPDKWVLNVFELPGFSWGSQKREKWLGLQDDFRTFRVERPGPEFFAFLAA